MYHTCAYRSRALGHYIFSRCGLRTDPDFTLLDMNDVFNIFKKEHQTKTMHHLMECHERITAFIKEARNRNRDVNSKMIRFECGLFDITFRKKFTECCSCPNNDSIYSSSQAVNNILSHKTDYTSTIKGSSSPESELPLQFMHIRKESESLSTNSSDTDDNSILIILDDSEHDKLSDDTMLSDDMMLSSHTTQSVYNDHPQYIDNDDDVSPLIHHQHNHSLKQKTFLLLMSGISHSNNLFLLFFVDGISDALSWEDIEKLVFELDDQGLTPLEIAQHVTLHAESM